MQDLSMDIEEVEQAVVPQAKVYTVSSEALSVVSSVHKVSGHDRDALLGTRGLVAPPARTGTRLLCRWCMWARRTPARPARPMARLTSAQKGLVQHALSANT